MGGPKSLPNLNMFGRTRINVETAATPANRSSDVPMPRRLRTIATATVARRQPSPRVGRLRTASNNAAPSHIWLLSDEVWSSRNRRYWKNVAAATPHRIASLKTHAGPANISIGVPSATTTFQVAGSQTPVSREPGSGHNS